MEAAFAKLAGIFIVFAIVGLTFFVLWIFAIIDVAKAEFKDQSSKTVWLLILLFLGPLGLILYWIIGEHQKLKSRDIPLEENHKRGNIPKIIVPRPTIEKDDRDFSFK
jgi:hypothetical protein